MYKNKLKLEWHGYSIEIDYKTGEEDPIGNMLCAGIKNDYGIDETQSHYVGCAISQSNNRIRAIVTGLTQEATITNLYRVLAELDAAQTIRDLRARLRT